MQSFLKDCVFDNIMPATAAGTSTINSDILDMQKYDTVICGVITGDVTNLSVLTLKAYVGDESDLSDGAYITATATITADATSADTSTILLEVKKPQSRYVRFDLLRATQNAVIAGAYAVRGLPRAKPVTQPSDVVASGFAVDV